MTHHEILSEEEFFGEFYAYPFSDCSSNMYTNEVGNSSEYSSDSDNVNIRPQKDKKTLVTDSDKVKMNLSAEEWSFISTEEWIEDNISQKLDSTGVSGITVECNNPQSVSKITELIFGWPREKSP